MKQNIIRKLSSRKFWCALAGFVTLLLTAFRVDEMTATQTVSVISAVGVLAAYILGESYVDGKASGKDNQNGKDEKNGKE